MVFAYVRVSSPDQNPDMQIDLFNKIGYDRLYIEKKSGVKRLLELERCINDMREVIRCLFMTWIAWVGLR